jgi:L-lysine 2,3-aminomutase
MGNKRQRIDVHETIQIHEEVAGKIFEKPGLLKRLYVLDCDRIHFKSIKMIQLRIGEI